MSGRAAAFLGAGIGVGIVLLAGCFSERVPTDTATLDCSSLVQGDEAPTEFGRIVVIRDFAFQQDSIEVEPGETVTWVNCEDTPVSHSSTSDDDVWNSGLLQPGAAFSFTFDEPGRYPYHCIPHPAMTGVVQVTE